VPSQDSSVEADRIDHESVPFPMSNGIAVPGGEQICRVLLAVEINSL